MHPKLMKLKIRRKEKKKKIHVHVKRILTNYRLYFLLENIFNQIFYFAENNGFYLFI